MTGTSDRYPTPEQDAQAYQDHLDYQFLNELADDDDDCPTVELTPEQIAAVLDEAANLAAESAEWWATRDESELAAMAEAWDCPETVEELADRAAKDDVRDAA